MQLKSHHYGLLICVFCVLFVSCTLAANRRARVCLQPLISGRCFGLVESYAYNAITRKCENFIYGGCGGNENRFESKAKCEQMCRDI